MRPSGRTFLRPATEEEEEDGDEGARPKGWGLLPVHQYNPKSTTAIKKNQPPIGFELELELIQAYMTQKPMLRVEVGAIGACQVKNMRGGWRYASATGAENTSTCSLAKPRKKTKQLGNVQSHGKTRARTMCIL